MSTSPTQPPNNTNNYFYLAPTSKLVPGINSNSPEFSRASNAGHGTQQELLSFTDSPTLSRAELIPG